MFAKNSRYVSLEEVRTVDSRGRVLPSKALRLIPKREAAMTHRVQKADRLDLLAHKYYGDPDKWWLIADANPEWQLPSDILDRFPLEKYVIDLDVSTPASDQKWLDLRRELAAMPGVVNLFIDRDGGRIYVELNEKITHLKEKITHLEAINEVIEREGFVRVDMPQRFPRTGAEIAIPPNQTT